MYSFKKAQRSQAEAIFALYRAVTLAGKQNGACDWSEDYPTREYLEDDLEMERVFVLEEDDALIAAVTLLETDDLDNEPVGWSDVKSCVVVRLCVSPEQQGKRIGEQMMNYLIDHAKQQGYQAVRLMAVVTHNPANRLYQRMGFRFLGVVELYDKRFNAYELLCEPHLLAESNATAH